MLPGVPGPIPSDFFLEFLIEPDGPGWTVVLELPKPIPTDLLIQTSIKTTEMLLERPGPDFLVKFCSGIY